jgi:hypothetical protein
LIVTVAVAVLPAASVAVAVMTWDGPSPTATPAMANCAPATLAATPSTCTVVGESSTTVPLTGTESAFVNCAATGLLMTSCGAARSILIVTEMVVVLPDASVATAVMVCAGPSPSGTVAANWPADTSAATPSTTTVVAEPSATLPRTSTDPALV